MICGGWIANKKKHAKNRVFWGLPSRGMELSFQLDRGLAFQMVLKSGAKREALCV